MADKICPLHFGLESGVPLIGFGALLLISAGVICLSQGAGALPIVVIFGAAGIFMVWAGIAK